MTTRNSLDGAPDDPGRAMEAADVANGEGDPGEASPETDDEGVPAAVSDRAAGSRGGHATGERQAAENRAVDPPA